MIVSERRAAAHGRTTRRAPLETASRATSSNVGRAARPGARMKAGPSGGVSGRMTVRLVRLLERGGHDAEVICRAIGIERDDVAAPSARVPYPIADALVEACARAFGPAGLAL